MTCVLYLGKLYPEITDIFYSYLRNNTQKIRIQTVKLIQKFLGGPGIYKASQGHHDIPMEISPQILIIIKHYLFQYSLIERDHVDTYDQICIFILKPNGKNNSRIFHSYKITEHTSYGTS